MTTNQSPSARYFPRQPNEAELGQLASWLQEQQYEPEDATNIAHAAYVAVYDDYCTGGPGYCGKLMSVVWDGSPSTFDVFTFDGGQMERTGREYDEKECDHCGNTNGTLCVNCWHAWERKLQAARATDALDSDRRKVLNESNAAPAKSPDAKPILCRTCGSEIVATINESCFNDGECGGCEYRRYKTQERAIDLLDRLLDRTFDQDLAFGNELWEDEKQLRQEVIDLLTDGRGKAA